MSYIKDKELSTIDGVEWMFDEPVKLQYDGYEVWPVRDINKDIPNWKEEDGTCLEQCEPEEAEMWSIYGHTTGEGLECIADCHSEAIAVSISTLLSLKLSSLKN